MSADTTTSDPAAEPNHAGARIQEPRPRPVVAIDGPAGAGKSTLARRLAERLGFVLIDTGALYRSVALAATEKGVPLGDETALAQLIAETDIRLEPGADRSRVYLNGVERSAEIRSSEVSEGASLVSQHAAVRQALLGVQRDLGRNGGVVMEGRDIGSVIFPDAEVKVFLTASAEERSQRRALQFEQNGQPYDIEALKREVVERDARDTQRKVAPLRRADDAHVIDSTGKPEDQVLAELIALVSREASE